MMRRWLLLLFATVLSPVSTTAGDVRATVVTQKGDTLEGVFKGGSGEDLVIEVAGQRLTLPLETVRYVSFVGRIESAASASGAASGVPSVDDAFKAFEELQAPLEIGVLRQQYAEKLQQTLPRVLAFLKAADKGWFPDAQLALQAAVENFQSPLRSVSSWSLANFYWSRARASLAYARQVLAEDPKHTEDPGEKVISLGSEVSGRLGFGDATAPGDSTLGKGFADVYRLTIAAPVKVRVTMTAQLCEPWAPVVDATGKFIAKKSDAARDTWTADLKTGTYKVYASCSFGQALGPYSLRVDQSR